MPDERAAVLDYDGMLLLQRVHDDVVITLLKHEIEDTPLPDHDKVRARPPSSLRPPTLHPTHRRRESPFPPERFANLLARSLSCAVTVA
jgi:hypothetical protein